MNVLFNTVVRFVFLIVVNLCHFYHVKKILLKKNSIVYIEEIQWLDGVIRKLNFINSQSITEYIVGIWIEGEEIIS
jgi:hypothetical protein